MSTYTTGSTTAGDYYFTIGNGGSSGGTATWTYNNANYFTYVPTTTYTYPYTITTDNTNTFTIQYTYSPPYKIHSGDQIFSNYIYTPPIIYAFENVRDMLDDMRHNIKKFGNTIFNLTIYTKDKYIFGNLSEQWEIKADIINQMEEEMYIADNKAVLIPWGFTDDGIKYLLEVINRI